VDYYTTAFAGKPEKAATTIFGHQYIRTTRKPRTGRGLLGFVSGMSWWLPGVQLHIKRVIAEGELGRDHRPTSDLERKRRTNRTGLLARLSAWGRPKVVEHWDVIKDSWPRPGQRQRNVLSLDAIPPRLRRYQEAFTSILRFLIRRTTCGSPAVVRAGDMAD